MTDAWGSTGQRAVSPAIVHENRTRMGLRFGEAASTYDRVRPRYPGEVYDWVLRHVGAPGRAADVGAGTGIFGEGLRDRGWSVIGIDPDHDLLALHPEPSRVGTAESLPIEDGTVDLVTVAQAWHWIDPVAASTEFRRVLTANGAVLVVVNQLDVRVEWVLRLARIMHAGDVYRPSWRPHLDGFGPMATAQFPFATTVTIDDVVELAATRSYWLRSDARIRDRVEGNIRSFLAGEGRALAAEAGDFSGDEYGGEGVFNLPYLCLGYCAPRADTR